MGMDLHGIVRGAINTVNDDIDVVWIRPNGSTTASDGRRTPIFTTENITAQVQGTSGKDLLFLNGMGFQGVFRLVFLSAPVSGIIRIDGKGGDFLRFPMVPGGDNRDWKAITVKETWPDWTSVFVQMQSELMDI